MCSDSYILDGRPTSSITFLYEYHLTTMQLSTGFTDVFVYIWNARDFTTLTFDILP